MITSGVGYMQKILKIKNTLSDFILPLQMHVQNHERVQNSCFYPFRKKLKENPVVWMMSNSTFSGITSEKTSHPTNLRVRVTRVS